MTWSISASGKKESVTSTLASLTFEHCSSAPERAQAGTIRDALLALVDDVETDSLTISASGSNTHVSCSMSKYNAATVPGKLL